MHDCDKFRSFFSNYIDGDLLPEARRELEAHLKICQECSESLYQVRMIRDSLRKLPRLTTSPEFEIKLHQQLSYLNGRNLPRFYYLFQNWKVPAVGSAIVLATIGFFMVFNTGDNNSSNEPSLEPQKFAPAGVHFPGKGPRLGAQQTQASTTIQNGSSVDSTEEDTTTFLNKGVQLIRDH